MPFILILLHVVIRSNYEEHIFDKAVIFKTELAESKAIERRYGRCTKEELLKEQEKVEKQELDLQKLIKENAALEGGIISQTQTGTADCLCSKAA